MNLPPTTHDFIFRDLSYKDLLSYSKVNRAANHAVKAFYRRALRVEKVLSRYFNNDEIRRFRILQYTTGCLISGSTALSFFEREIYPESDLDIYVDFRYAIFFAHFLLSLGFVYLPFQTEHKNQASDIIEALHAMDERLESFEIQNETIDGFESYRWTGIADVFTFVRDEKKIQIIAAGHDPSPLDVILGFHSTVVMNIIAYSHAISFYPKATFVDRITVVNSLPNRSGQWSPREKYAQRGWEIRSDVDPLTMLDNHSEFSISDRCVGDRHCWTVELPDVTDFVGCNWALGQDWMLFSNSWNNQHDHGFTVKSMPFYIPPLAQSYSTSQRVLQKIQENDLFTWDDERPTTGGIRYIDDTFSDFVENIIDNPPEQDERDTFAQDVIRQIFKAAQLNYPLVESHKQVEKSALYHLLQYLQKLVKQTPELPKFEFRLAQSLKGHVWTNLDVELPPNFDAPSGEKGSPTYEPRLQCLQSWRMNVKFKSAKAT